MYPYYLYSNMPKLNRHKVWAEIDTQALAENFRTLCANTASGRHICVVKSDAYGHISDVCVRALMAEGCDFFAVSCIEEALKIKPECGDGADILILGYTDPSQVETLAENNIIQAVISEKYALLLAESAKEKNCKLRVHVAIDTGMNRIGLCAADSQQCDRAAEFILELSRHKSLSLEGIFTHFAEADAEIFEATKKDSKTAIQFERFQNILSKLRPQLPGLFCHACNSAAALHFPEYALDAVRFGISLYGVPPSKHFERITKPVMSLHTVISHIHSLDSSEKVGYGGNYAPGSDRIIATLPIGYADGFLRAYTGFCVTVRSDSGDFKAPIVGNICMDQCMIDITDVPCSVGDHVIIFGEDPEDLATLAYLADTIEYEVLCLISARVPRILKSKK